MKWIAQRPTSDGFYFFKVRDEDLYSEMDEPHNEVVGVVRSTDGLFAVWLDPRDDLAERFLGRAVEDLDGLWTRKLRQPAARTFKHTPPPLYEHGPLGSWYWFMDKDTRYTVVVEVRYIDRDYEVAIPLRPSDLYGPLADRESFQSIRITSKPVTEMKGLWAGPIRPPEWVRFHFERS